MTGAPSRIHVSISHVQSSVQLKKPGKELLQTRRAVCRRTLDTGEGGPGDGMPMPCACMAASSTSGGDDGVKASSMSDVELTCRVMFDVGEA
eukprot:1147994-Pelagomonas_calceolata.AAC.2